VLVGGDVGEPARARKTPAFPGSRASRKLRRPECPARERNMPAYFVAEVEVTNPSGYEPYLFGPGL